MPDERRRGRQLEADLLEQFAPQRTGRGPDDRTRHQEVIEQQPLALVEDQRADRMAQSHG
jgi:hypothetical protein